MNLRNSVDLFGDESDIDAIQIGQLISPDHPAQNSLDYGAGSAYFPFQPFDKCEGTGANRMTANIFPYATMASSATTEQ